MFPNLSVAVVWECLSEYTLIQNCVLRDNLIQLNSTTPIYSLIPEMLRVCDIPLVLSLYKGLLSGIFLSFFLSFSFFRTACMAYGGSQARGWIGALAASLHHSHCNAGSTPRLCLHHSSLQCRILNPLSEVRDRTRNLMVPSRIHFHCATTGTPYTILLNWNFLLFILNEILLTLIYLRSTFVYEQADILLHLFHRDN